MAYGATSRERSFDASTFKLASNTDLFAGPSSKSDSTNYPGDIKIVGEDSITIQLYRFYLKGAPMDFAREAYTIAINYPKSLAVNYCSNEAVNQEDDDE